MEPKHRAHDYEDADHKLSKLELSSKIVPSDCEAKSVALKSDENRVAEAKLDLEVEREWKQLQHDTGAGRIEVSKNPRTRKISKGLTM